MPVNLRWLHFTRPREVPIQRLPSRVPSRECIRALGRCSPLEVVKGTNRTPSKRTNPPSVPTHRYPSAVWAIACGVPLKKPSAVRHAVWAYWEICRLWSAAGDEIVKKAREIQVSNAGERSRLVAVEKQKATQGNLERRDFKLVFSAGTRYSNSRSIESTVKCT